MLAPAIARSKQAGLAGAKEPRMSNDTMPNPAELFFGRGAAIVHPCNAFAQRAGYQSWAEALEAMRAGKIVTATAPRIGLTMIDFRLFAEQIRKDGLMTVTLPQDELGFVSVGLREHFPVETLARVERETAERGLLNPFRLI